MKDFQWKRTTCTVIMITIHEQPDVTCTFSTIRDNIFMPYPCDDHKTQA
jgi:hypothetical protein